MLCLLFIKDINWHINFKVPEKEVFGFIASKAITTGVVTSAARRNMIFTLMIQHTHILLPVKSIQQYAIISSGNFPNLEMIKEKEL